VLRGPLEDKFKLQTKFLGWRYYQNLAARLRHFCWVPTSRRENTEDHRKRRWRLDYNVSEVRWVERKEQLLNM